MKGISLAIETIVVLILAVVVLMSLLVFFNIIVPPGTEEVNLKFEQTQACNRYVGLDSDCIDAGSIAATNPGITEKIEDVGKKLGYSGCGADIQGCVEQVCSTFCIS